jgi:DNA-binding response OmpR family regulator
MLEMKDKKILLIDDDTGFLYLTSLLFKKAGAEVFTARDGLEGISKLFTHQPDLTILDLTMPGIDGFEVCSRIRQFSDMPIIIVTSVNEEQDMLRGLDAGADDFLTKPFNPDVLLARAAAVLRRSGRGQSPTERSAFDNGHLVIDFERHEVLVRGKRIKVTPTEFSLLTFLVRNAGKVLTFEQILTKVWGNQYGRSADYVHVYISHLRTKIEENPKQPRYLLTVHGIGYVFEK